LNSSLNTDDRQLPMLELMHHFSCLKLISVIKYGKTHINTFKCLQLSHKSQDTYASIFLQDFTQIAHGNFTSIMNCLRS